VCKFTRRAAFVIAHDKLYHLVLPEVSPSFCHDGLAHSQSYDDGLAHIEMYPEVSPSFCHDGLAHSQSYDDGLAHIELYPEVSPSLCHDGLAHSQFYDDGLAHTKLYLRSRPRSAMMVSPTASSTMMVSPSTWSTTMSFPSTVSPSSTDIPSVPASCLFYIPLPIDSIYAHSNLKVAQYLYQ